MASGSEPVGLADYLLIAEQVLREDARRIKRAAKISLAESALAAPHMGWGDQLFYPDPVERAAILCSRLIRNHPLPDGNKRVAYVAMLDQLGRDGFAFEAEDQDHVADVIEALAAGEIPEEAFVAWVRERTR